jgi:hypothetical protein
LIFGEGRLTPCLSLEIKSREGDKVAHSDYEIGKPYRGSDRGYFRRDLYKPSGDLDRVFVTGRDDLSPVFNGKYDPECSCCWLGFGHSEAFHEHRAGGR